MKPKIRPMQQSDIDAVHAIEVSSHRAPWSKDILSDCVLVGYDCLVLEHAEKQGSRILGYIICRHSLNTCHILNLCIAPSEQGKGYGSELLQFVLDALHAQRSFKSVILEVRPSNLAALALYEKYGFIQDSIKKDYYTDHDCLEDAILLKKDLI